jgi:large subunit ribosomal protein L9
MQIILLEQVKNLGKVGEVVTVKYGYARNFLLPNKKALRATKANVDLFEVQKADIEKNNQELIKIAQAFAKKVDGIIVPVAQQAGEDGRLYGSVTITDIANAVSEKVGEKLERKLIELHDPIKYIGVHAVQVDLHAEVTVTVNVNVARTADEAKAAAARFAKGESVMEGPGANNNAYVEEEAEEAPSAAPAEEDEADAETVAEEAAVEDAA